MEDAIKMGRILHDTPDLLPWVVFVAICVLMYKERDLIRQWFTSFIKSREETSLFHAQQNELVRNNTAALDNNTEMLKILKQDRKDMVNSIEQHELLSMERMERIQGSLDAHGQSIQEMQQNVKLLVDRTSK